ncbi:YggW family oxidoreductase [Gammaproteobacteria bacterium 42_54_T18]|nr:YggW family oxidoreductase [Gammaproteobacteria bacterium 42_54_T18]
MKTTETTTLTLEALPPLSLYIHIPWCIRKCPYCDFNSHQTKEATSSQPGFPENAYIDALLEDLTTDFPFVQGRNIETLFFGGGTPSLLSASALERLLIGIHAIVPIAENAEITLEANPGTFEQEKFTAYRRAGINRLSIGVQSFQPEQLVNLGRIHNQDEATEAAGMAHQAGFNKLNIDLMYGLHNQTPEQALNDLSQAVALNPSHISWYQLTIEPNTVFYNKPPTLPEDDALWDIQEAGQAYLQEQGYLQYEISAYAKKENRCLHNVNYWQFGDYLGIGAGAHGKITLGNTQEIIRYQKTRMPTDYLNRTIDKTFLSSSSRIDEDERAMEFFMNGLRLNEGISKQHFFQRTLQATLPKALIQPLQQATTLGLLLETNERWQPTALGRQHLNTLLQLFI